MIEMTGKRFGRLVVLEYAGRNSGNNSLWRCRCDCGNEITTTGTCLRLGMTKSCGCYAKERTIATNRARSRGLCAERARLAALRKEEREKELQKALETPIEKSQFDDLWMFGDHETENKKWFNAHIK